MRPRGGPVRELLLSARSSGRPAEIHARLAGDSHAMVVSATPFRARAGMRLLVRVRPLGAAGAGDADTRRVQAWRAERLREAVVVTDSGGRVLAANPPFLRWCGPATRPRCADAHRRLAGACRQRRARADGRRARPGIASLQGATLRAGTAVTGLQVSAALLADGDQACFGFTMRPARRAPAPNRAAAARTTSRRPSPRWPTASAARRWSSCWLQSQRLTQRHLAQAALARCDGDEAAAAALLGTTPAELASMRPAQRIPAPRRSPGRAACPAAPPSARPTSPTASAS